LVAFTVITVYEAKRNEEWKVTVPIINANSLTEWKNYLDDSADHAVDNVFDGLNFIHSNLARATGLLASLPDDLDLLKKHFAESGGEITQLKRELFREEGLVDKIERQLEACKGALASDKVELHGVEGQLRELRQRNLPRTAVKLLEARRIQLTNKIAELYISIDRLSVDLNVARKEVQMAEEKLSLSASVQSGEEQILSEFSAMQDELTQRVEQLRNNLTKLNQSIKSQSQG